MGVVYEAYDADSDKLVALKTLVRADASAIYRFKREFRSLSDVAHPNLVSLYEMVAEGDYWFFTMELVEGTNFLEYVTDSVVAGSARDNHNYPTDESIDGNTQDVRVDTAEIESPVVGAADPTETLDLADIDSWGGSGILAATLIPLSVNLDRLRAALRQLAEGVLALHEMGKLHRDIKPPNVLVTKEGRVVILDFGLITEVEPDANSNSLHVAGTPAYMSPEQGAGHPITEASDWYSVGVMLYEALTGRLPFTGQFIEVLVNKQKYEPPPPSEIVAGIPEDLDKLCRDLLRRPPAERPSGRDILERLGGVQLSDSVAVLTQAAPAREPNFVGRERQLDALTDSFLATRLGRTVSVYVHGNSGMGKTALVRHFLDELQRREEAVVVAGRCYERESVPYKALDGVIDSLSRYLMSLSRAKADALMPRDVLALSRLFPVMLRVDSIANAPHREQDIPDLLALRRRAFAALREMLARISDRRPLVIYIDDLQWADADSTALLDDLLRPPNPPPLLLVASFRSEEIDQKPFLRKLLGQTGTDACREILVEPLTKDEARRLAYSLLPADMPGAGQFVESIVRESGGSPFFVEQLTRYALTAERAATTGITLAQMLDAGIRQLPTGARELLELLAVAGRPVDAEVAYQAAGLTGDERSLVTALRASHFLRSSGSVQRIELYHDRIRETISGMLDPDTVRRIHGSLVGALESRGYDDPESLFEHYLGAGDKQRAARQAVLAARKADSVLAFDRAALYYRRALDLSPEAATNPVELEARLGDALANAGRPAQAARIYLAAARHSDAKKALEFQRRAAAQLLMGGHIDEGLDVIRTVLAALGLKLAAGPKRALLSLLVRRAQLLARGFKFTERDASQIPEDRLLKIDTCWAVAAGLAMVDNIRGADFQTRHLLLALQAGEPYRIARAMAFEAGFAASPGGPTRNRAARVLKAAEALARKVDHPHATGLVHFTAGVAAYLTGEWKRAVELSERAAEILRDQCTGVVWELSSAQRMMLSSLMYLGELEEISYKLPALLAAAKEQGNLYAATDLRVRLNIMWLAADDPNGARQEVIESLQAWSQEGFHLQHYNAFAALTQIELYTGDGLVAWKHITSQWPVIRKSMLLRIQILRIEAMYLQARSALAVATIASTSRMRIDKAERVAEAERYARLIERERMDWSDPLVSLLRAGVASVKGDDRLAASLLSSAADAFKAADMKLYWATAQRRLGQLLGGDEGGKLVAEAESWMLKQKIKNPALITRMLAPGFPKD